MLGHLSKFLEDSFQVNHCADFHPKKRVENVREGHLPKKIPYW
jgi:hypothetical protein